MRKIVKCSDCGKKHTIEANITDHLFNRITFKPVSTAWEKIKKKAQYKDNYVHTFPDIVYLGKYDASELYDDALMCQTSEVMGFKIIIVDQDRYFGFGASNQYE